QMARVREPVARWRRLRLIVETLGARAAALEVAELPRDGRRWSGLPFAPDARPPSGRVSLILHRAAAAPPAGAWAGLLVDEWTEIIPSTKELTGVAFHYDDPGAEAPQAVLVAVPPRLDEMWSFADVVATLHETLDLAKVRAVDGDLLGLLAQV